MHCYEYLAIQHYARVHLGEWTEKFDDLELAETLDDEDVTSFRDIKRMN